MSSNLKLSKKQYNYNFNTSKVDEKLNFKNHVKEKIIKAIKGIPVIKKLSGTLRRDTLLKLFVKPHLDYGDTIHDQLQNESFCNKLKSLQYNTALTITRAIQGTSKIKL